ncbi:hypothetical protein K469DRAFT_726376 [Zopfia rhizophila CBS 207.26]|uniref:Uncharacterized protein n=1 Tax=Zopfia rhizophila CBS 207.26 TaxID=1314779 RepID=A0A6A6E703_9PEZI|nr:hypothetical protein K469DRAFT_726376 [Zopfia rhizophila CBS 207.26]
MTAHGPGSANGVLKQLGDGQNRIGGGLGVGSYCLKDGGNFVDGYHRGCILTPPTRQFQCDEGATPTPGFKVGCNGGAVTYKGSETFYACPVNDNGEWNVYTQPAPGQAKCVAIKLTATGSNSKCKPPVTAPQPAPLPTGGCPADLDGAFEFPHLIIPLDKNKPDKAFGTKFNGAASSSICTAFNFDIHEHHAGKTCSLIFLFPQKWDLETSDFELKGEGGLEFSKLDKPCTVETTWKSKPHETPLKDFGVEPGHNYHIWSGACPAGQRVSYLMCGHGSVELEYFQDWNPSPIGLYMRQC